jgi:hypothetical protein
MLGVIIKSGFPNPWPLTPASVLLGLDGGTHLEPVFIDLG